MTWAVHDTIPSPDSSEPERQFTAEWQKWAAFSLLDGVPLRDVLEVLASNGLPAAESVLFCARLYDSPVFAAGQWMASKVHKLESLLTMCEQMQRTAETPVSVDRRSGISSEVFRDEYYARNEPLIMNDVCDGWMALDRWTPSYLVDTIGSAEVEVMSGRDSDDQYEIHSDLHKFRMPFDEFVAKIQANPVGNDTYLVANNKLLESAAAAHLWSDFDLDPRFLRPDPGHSQAFLWFGPAGTVTPLHHDTVNVLFNQVRGTKRFFLIPAMQIHRVYNRVGVFGDVDPVAPDLTRYPRFSGVCSLEFEIGPGETLFIPAGWWHRVEAVDMSISVSFTNFNWDNNIDWVHPGITW